MPTNIFSSTSLQSTSFESLKVNYLTIPVYVVACLILGVVTAISDRLRKRAVIALIPTILAIVGYAVVIGTPAAGPGYFAMFMCSGGKQLHAKDALTQL